MIGDVEDVSSRIRRQARKNAAGQIAMEKLVLEAHRDGQSLRQIAKDAAMTPEGVRKMIARVEHATGVATQLDGDSGLIGDVN
jgi:hypothetical protein